MNDTNKLHTASASRRTSVPADAIWQVLSSLDRLAEWAPGIDGATILSTQKAGVGAVRQVATAQFGEIEHQITRWEAERIFAYETADSGPFSRTITTYNISSSSGGEVTVDVTIAFAIHPGKIEADQATTLLNKGLAATLQALELRARLVREEV